MESPRNETPASELQHVWIAWGRTDPRAMRVLAHVREIGPNRIPRLVADAPWNEDGEALWTIASGDVEKAEAERLMEERILGIQSRIICGVRDNTPGFKFPPLPGLPCS